MKLNRIDHFVLTVTDLDAATRFYSAILGMDVIRFGDDGMALRCGAQTINLRELRKPPALAAAAPTPGSAAFCLIAETDIDEITAHLQTAGIEIEKGPLTHTGALGLITSIYVRDPDRNLVEIAVYPPTDDEETPG